MQHRSLIHAEQRFCNTVLWWVAFARCGWAERLRSFGREVWAPYLADTLLRVFASASISGQLGRFTRPMFDYTAGSVRTQVSMSPFLSISSPAPMDGFKMHAPVMCATALLSSAWPSKAKNIVDHAVFQGLNNFKSSRKWLVGCIQVAS